MQPYFYKFECFSKHNIRKSCNPILKGFLISSLMMLLANMSSYGQVVVVKYFTPGSYTWTCPDSITSIGIECIGGGGAGGGAITGPGNIAGGGGGGGANVIIDSFAVIPYTDYCVNVGAGGLGVPGGNGGAGEDSWFGSSSTVLAVGGAGGSSGSNGVGGYGTGGVGGAAGSCIPSIDAIAGCPGGSAANSSGNNVSGHGGGGVSGTTSCTSGALGVSDPAGSNGYYGDPIGGGGSGGIAGGIITTATGGGGATGAVVLLYNARPAPLVGVVNLSKNKALNLKVLPNPCSGKAIVQFNIESPVKYNLKIYDLTARVLMNKIGEAQPGTNQSELDLSNYSKGMYLLSLQTGKNNQQIKLIVE